METDTAADVCGSGVGDCPARPADCHCDTKVASFHPGQKVELAVQVGSWKEGTPCLIIGEEDGSLPYEWRVTVLRDCGSLDASMYEHELRPRQPSLIERLVARTDDEWLVGYKGWGAPGVATFPISSALWNDMLGVTTTGPVAADGEDPFGAAVDALYTEAQELLLSKHQDYGPKNISQAPGGALNGLRVRIWDKVARLNHLTSEDASPNHEGLRDTLLDLANYALIGCLVLNDNWPSD